MVSGPVDVDDLDSFSMCMERLQHGGDCLDTCMLQSMVYINAARNAMHFSVWDVVDKLTSTEIKPGGLEESLSANTTHHGVRILEEVARANVSHVVHAPGSDNSGLAWVLMIAVSVVVFACIFCTMRQVEQRSTVSVPRVSDPRRNESLSQVGSFASVSSAWARRKHDPQASYQATPTGSAVSLARSTRSSRAGAALSSRVLSSGAARGHGSARSLGREARLSVGATPRTRAATQAAQDAPGCCASGHLFVLPVGALLDAAEGGSLNISDTYSSMTLGAVASRGEDGSRKLELFLGQEAVRQCASAEAPPPGLAVRPDSFVLRGANGQHLGSLALQGDGSFAVSIRAQPQLTIDGNETDLNFRVASGDGRALATVLCKEEVPGGPEHLSIQVSPGADPVTIVTCTLAILLFVGEG
mmetsp:Transcript_92061/g.249797  ORF Transcript_92061/g.249797 Transcript_92061/m.249797 type:complete len:415 (+) Transcript_92061:177-1421(+)